MLEMLGGFILSKVVIGVVSAVILVPAGVFIGSKVKKAVVAKKQALINSLKKIQDKEFRKFVEDLILNAQKLLGTESGKQKFNIVKRQILEKVPDLLDPAVGAVIQAIYDGLISQNKI